MDDKMKAAFLAWVCPGPDGHTQEEVVEWTLDYLRSQQEQAGEVHPDDAAVDAFAAAMKEKLAAARAKGRGGWNSDEPGMQQRLSDMLRDHVEKGDPRDVANFCMFLHQRGESILPHPAEQRGQPKRRPYNASGSLSEYGVFPECDAQQPADDEVVFIDGVGAGRSSIKSCHDGVQWIMVGDRVYWPLSDSDAKRLRSACCGNGSFDGPATPDQLAEGEEIMVNTPYDVFTLPLQPSGLDGKGPRFVVHVPGPEHTAYAGCTIWRGSLRVSVTETKVIEHRIDADEAFCDLVQRALDSLAAAWDAAALKQEGVE